MNFGLATRHGAVLAAFLASGTALAGEVRMAGGSVNFSTPDDWVGIMETQGDPEVRVFQVPDPSPDGAKVLARVTVTVKQAADAAAFQQYVGDASTKAQQLQGYHALPRPPEADTSLYTARENGMAFSYRERYWFKDGHAIQLRCVRPEKSPAGATWTAAFDRGCAAIAARL